MVSFRIKRCSTFSLHTWMSHCFLLYKNSYWLLSSFQPSTCDNVKLCTCQCYLNKYSDVHYYIRQQSFRLTFLHRTRYTYTMLSYSTEMFRQANISAIVVDCKLQHPQSDRVFSVPSRLKMSPEPVSSTNGDRRLEHLYCKERFTTKPHR